MNRLFVAAPALLAITCARPHVQRPDVGAPDRLEVLDVRFDPIARGKNVVHIQVRNPSKDDQVFAVHIQTRSPDFGRGMGAGVEQFETVAAGETRTLRFAFKLPGPPTPRASVRLRFYALPNRERFDFQDFDGQRSYTADQLPIREPAEGDPVPLSSAEANPVLETFRRLQIMLHERKFHDAWNEFTPDWQRIEYKNEETFAEAMRGEGLRFAYVWDPHDLLKLRLTALHRLGATWRLTAKRGRQTWTIDLVRHEGAWRVDWINGVPLALQWASWSERLRHEMQRRHTRHYEIYYKAGTSAAREIETIAAGRERAYRAITAFIASSTNTRINLFLFEDERSKWKETGHRGAGSAMGDTLVEVYNAQEKLDPYHEPTHILMRRVGSPPAALNEGFAVYIAEHLGRVPALAQLGGGKATLDQRARQLKSAGDWIPLDELLGYTEIGPAETRPAIAYPLAGSFVKFLIERHGKDKFFQAYRTLSNSSDESVRGAWNRQILESIYGRSIKQLESAWIEAMSTPRDR